MTTQHKPTTVHVGDWLEAHGLPGQPSRRGQIVEILGEPGHTHYRVRWDEKHESIFFPTEGVEIVPRPPRRGQR